MNWLKKSLGIGVLTVSLLFGGITNARAETLEVVFKSSLWGSAIGGVSGLALWALQEAAHFFPSSDDHISGTGEDESGNSIRLLL